MKPWHKKKKYKKYNWKAVDSNGKAWVYVAEPEIDSPIGGWGWGGNCEPAPEYDTDGRNWQSSLEKRPEKKKPPKASADDFTYAAIFGDVMAALIQISPLTPTWDDAPEWAKTLAMDEGGSWYWYETENLDIHGGGYGFYSSGGRHERARCRNWRHSVMKRPKK